MKRLIDSVILMDHLTGLPGATHAMRRVVRAAAVRAAERAAVRCHGDGIKLAAAWPAATACRHAWLLSRCWKGGL